LEKSEKFYKRLTTRARALVVSPIMTIINHASPAAAARLSDRDLLDATARAAADERRTTAELIALLAELDSRKLYLGEGYSSLFAYCRHRLHLSEFCAYSRITAARAARRFPILLVRLAEGAVTLSSIGLLAAHLTDENHEALLDAVQHARKRDVELLVASLYGQPDIPASVRRLPEAEESEGHDQAPVTLAAAVAAVAEVAEEPAMSLGPAPAPTPLVVDVPGAATLPALQPPTSLILPTPPTLPTATTATTGPTSPTSPTRRDVVAPLAVGRYLLRVTIGAETHARLDRARDLLRHVVPDGDLALVLDRALAVLVDQLERRKTGRLSDRARQARTQTRTAPPRGRHIPVAVKREVWNRDLGRCAFIGSDGRCHETGFLEYHHVVPYARGGATGAANLELRCRAHNAYEAEREFGEYRRGGAPAG
jgi:5-methylcytosine-specific restriction endonuclease McrA